MQFCQDPARNSIIALLQYLKSQYNVIAPQREALSCDPYFPVSRRNPRPTYGSEGLGVVAVLLGVPEGLALSDLARLRDHRAQYTWVFRVACRHIYLFSSIMDEIVRNDQCTWITIQ